MTNIRIPKNVTEIGNDAFRDRTDLSSITIPSSVTSIGNNAFSGCTGLTSITIPHSVTEIGVQAFSDCTGLTSVIFESSSSVSVIKQRAFSNCTGLTTVLIPISVTTIGWGLFMGCTRLTVYAETAKRQVGWNEAWNILNSEADERVPVQWGSFIINPPQYLRAIPGDKRVTLDWQIPMPGSLELILYRVYRDDVSIVNIKNQTYTDTDGLSNGSPYFYHVIAVYQKEGVLHESSSSNTVIAVPDP